MRSIAKQEVPQVGMQYHFFDDGKITPSRHSVATVTRVIPFNEAKNIFVKARDWDCDDVVFAIRSIVDVWKEDVEQHHWLMANETDYFVECSIPDYDENLIWFARTTDDGWFSMNIQSSWQGGCLDVDGYLYKYFSERFPECV